MEVTEDDEGGSGSSVDVPFDSLYGQGFRSSRINLLIICTQAGLVKIATLLRNEKCMDLDNNYRCVDLFNPMKTFACNGLVYHVHEDSLAFSRYITKGLFFCNTIILVFSGRDALRTEAPLELKQQLVKLADYMKQTTRIIIIVGDMDYQGKTWDEARYNDLKEKIIQDLPLLNSFNATWIPLPLRSVIGATINIYGENQLVPWYKGQTLGECLCRLPEEHYQLQKYMTLNDTNLPCRFSVLYSRNVRGFPHLLNVTGQVMAGTIRKDKSYTFGPLKSLLLVKVVRMTSGGVNVRNGYPGDVLELMIYSENSISLKEVDTISGSVISDAEQPCLYAAKVRAEIDVLVEFIPEDGLVFEMSGFKAEVSLKDVRLSDGTSVLNVEKGDKLNVTIATVNRIPAEAYLGRTTWGLFVLKKEIPQKTYLDRTSKVAFVRRCIAIRWKEFEDVVAVGKILGIEKEEASPWE